jgi:hypothetical protein
MDDELDSWADAINRRGIFGRRSDSDKPIVECSTAQEWARSMQAEFAIEVSDIVNAAADPPDCIAHYKGRPISIEMTELLKPEIRTEIDQARKRGEYLSTSAGDLFIRAQWTRSTLLSAINERLDDKQGKYARRNFFADVLVIHTDEPWLSPYQVKEWLSDTEISARPNIRSAYLLRSHFPAYSEHWPVFSLYGDL